MNISKRGNLNSKLKLNLKSQSVEIKKEIIELKKIPEPKIKNLIKQDEIEKKEETVILKSVKKEIYKNNKDVIATTVNKKSDKTENKNNKNIQDSKEKTCKGEIKKFKLKNDKTNFKLTNSNFSLKETKSFISDKNSLTKQEDFKPNCSMILPTNITNKKDERLNSKILSKSKYLPKPKATIDKKSSLEKNEISTSKSITKISQNEQLLSNCANIKKISNGKLDLFSSSPSTPKSKTQILNSQLISSPLSSSDHESEFKKPKIEQVNTIPSSSQMLKSSKELFCLKNEKLLNHSLPQNSKELCHAFQNPLLHTPSKLSIKSSSKIKANQSFCIANNFNKRTQEFNNNDKSFINYNKNLVKIKKIKLNSNKEENTHNKDNRIFDTKFLSDDIKEESSKSNLFFSDPNEVKNVKANNKLVVSKGSSYPEKKKVTSCPHYLMPTKNWKTKIIKQLRVNETKASNSRLSPISNKVKSTIKLLSLSKSIKKKANNTIINTKSINNKSINNKNNINTNESVLTSIVTTSNIGTKVPTHYLYTHKDSKNNSEDSRHSMTPIINKSKTLSTHLINKTITPSINQESKKEKINKKIVNRSATLPISTPSKRINKNIKRNNIAFTEENEQDINQMFISAETLKSTSIDSFFSHYNNIDIEKKNHHRYFFI